MVWTRGTKSTYYNDPKGSLGCLEGNSNNIISKRNDVDLQYV